MASELSCQYSQYVGTLEEPFLLSSHDSHLLCFSGDDSFTSNIFTAKEQKHAISLCSDLLYGPDGFLGCFRLFSQLKGKRL